jgi:DNA adenine methylase
MTTALRPPLKWHGGKRYVADDIVDLMPPRVRNPNKPADDDPGWLHYVEPFAGGLRVLLANDPRGISEVVNDLDGHLMNFWRVLQSEERFQEFRRIIEVTPFSQVEWEDAVLMLRGPNADPVRWAAAFFVVNRQSRAGRMDGFATMVRKRTRRGMNDHVSAWWSAVEGLPPVAQRLKRVLLLNCPAVEVIRQEDGPRTLFYCDPPYVPSTRTAPNVYGHEMTEAEHVELLDVLKGCEGKVLLSGYRCDLYDRMLVGWNRRDFDVPNNAAGGDNKRRMTESVWINY